MATRTAFSLGYRCHEVAAALFAAACNHKDWDKFVEDVDEPTFLGPHTFVQGITYGDLQEGKRGEERRRGRGRGEEVCVGR